MIIPVTAEWDACSLLASPAGLNLSPNSRISAQLLVCSLTAKWESWLARAWASQACSWLDNAKLPKPRFMERFGVFLILCDFCWSISPGSKWAELLWSRDNWGSAITTFSLTVCGRSSCVLVLTWCSLLSALADPDFDYRHRNTSTLSDRVLMIEDNPQHPLLWSTIALQHPVKLFWLQKNYCTSHETLEHKGWRRYL
jgi:hypothetical protein